MTHSTIDIQLLPHFASTNVKDMERITRIINRVYASSEKGFWLDEAVRTSVDEITEFTHKGEMAVAQLNGQIVGCVRIRTIDKETGEFGMLAVDEKLQGSGIGRDLIRFAEQTCKREHHHKMQLELLVSQESSHPAKTILQNWYSRIGYQPIDKRTVQDLYPALASLLAIPSEFVVFQKDLTSGGGR